MFVSPSSLPALKGYRVLNIRLFPESSSYRSLFYKVHSHSSLDSSSSELPSGRTLFVINVPPHFNVSDLSAVFSCFGEVESVILLPTRKSEIQEAQAYYRSSHIIFTSSESIKIALSTEFEDILQPFQEGNERIGLKEYRRWYSLTHPAIEALQGQVDRFMESFDHRTAQERKAARDAPLIDEEGFIMVKKRQINVLQQA